MGGMGSGNRWRYGEKDLTTDFRSIDVRRWAKGGQLQPDTGFRWQWSIDGEQTGLIEVTAGTGYVVLNYRSREYGGDWEPMKYRVTLEQTPCNLGGYRYWFRCPAQGCGRRVAILYGGRVFACRHCHDLAYPSTREDASDRYGRKADRIRARLGWEAGILNGNGPKPKGMHHKTFMRLSFKHDVYVNASIGHLASRFGISAMDDVKAFSRLL